MAKPTKNKSVLGKVTYLNEEYKFGKITGVDGQNYRFEFNTVNDDIILEYGDIVSVGQLSKNVELRSFGKTQERKELRATDVKFISIAKRVEPLSSIQYSIAIRIMAANKYLESIQVGRTNIDDGKGYNNGVYITGFRLQQMWEDTACARFKPLIARIVAVLIKPYIKYQVGPSGNHPMNIDYPDLKMMNDNIDAWTTEKLNSFLNRGRNIAKIEAKPMSWTLDNVSDLLIIRSTDEKMLKELASNCGMYIDPNINNNVPQLIIKKEDAYLFIEYINENQDLIKSFPAGKTYDFESLKTKIQYYNYKTDLSI